MEKITIAIVYDFDGTLSPGNMQEHKFLPSLGISPEMFWKEMIDLAEEHDIDRTLAYMYLMLVKSSEKGMRITRNMLRECMKDISLFPGVAEWFETINAYRSDVVVEHHIVSSGLREMVRGTDIAKFFKGIFACDFIYDKNGAAIASGLGVNYTNKTQFLFRIHKGIHQVSDLYEVNRFVPKEKIAVPFPRMIYIGDGETDIPCFSVLKQSGGYGIGVYARDNDRARDAVERLVQEKRVRYSAPADFRDGEKLMTVVRGLIDHIHAQDVLERLSGV